MTSRASLILIAFLSASIIALPGADGGVVVLSNRTTHDVRFTISSEHSTSTEYVLQVGELATLPLFERSELSFISKVDRMQRELMPDSAYCFQRSSDGIELSALSVPKSRRDSPEPASRTELAKGEAQNEQGLTIVIPVKILVDEKEPTVQRRWEERIRKRIASASDILERHCRVRLEIVATGKWESANQLSNFRDMLRDFEQKVSPLPARLAIGFTAQPFAATECTLIGSTRGALHTHILIREWFGRTEPERLEVLLHELGHVLGAAHSAEADSVMRPKLGDGKAVSRKFRIGFDPLNTLAMSLVSQAAGRQQKSGMQTLDTNTLGRLRDLYQDMVQVYPDDAIAAAYVRRLGGSAGPAGSREVTRSEAIRQVIAAIVTAAEQNQERPGQGAADRDTRLTDDKLTEYYFRHAAERAARLPREHSTPALLLGLAVALDTSDMLRTNEWTRQIWETMESDGERQHRLGVIGLPTMQSRHDLLQHFVVSCALTVLSGPQIAEAVGILKEMNDANGGSGFSFVDLTADLAGISFATRLQAEPNRLARLANSFVVTDYMPAISDLREGLTREDLRTDYGSPSDPRFLRERAKILKLIQSLPGSEKED